MSHDGLIHPAWEDTNRLQVAEERIATLEAEVTRLRNLLASASIACYVAQPTTWQEEIRASLAKTYAQAAEHEAGEIIERIEKEKA